MYEQKIIIWMPEIEQKKILKSNVGFMNEHTHKKIVISWHENAVVSLTWYLNEGKVANEA